MPSSFPKQLVFLGESVEVRYSESPETSAISAHSHNFVEFSYLAGGSGIETINQEPFQMCPGYFSIIYPWQTHALQFDPNPSHSYYHVAISMDNFLGAGSVALDLKDVFMQTGHNTRSYYYFKGTDAERVTAAFREMFAEYNTRRKWWDLSVKSKITDVLICFDRKISSEKEGAAATQGLRQQTMDIVYYIYNNFKDDINLSSLSKHFGLSQNYLSTIIKASLGLSFLDFLQNIRLKYACTLLASTSMSVTDIAYASGFQSYRNFERFFRKHYRKSPTQYRSSCYSPYQGVRIVTDSEMEGD